MIHLMSGNMAAEVSGKNTTIQHERRALLCYPGTFQSMDGEVTITEEHLRGIAENHNAKLAKLGPDAGMAHCPPVQLDHSTSARDTVGRLVGPLEVGEHAGAIALFGQLRFLGAENWDRVEDGRWTHLSIGADLETLVLQEITVTPFPAARGACLLSRFGGHMDEAAELAYLMASDGINEDEAKEKLARMSDDEKIEMRKCMQEKTEGEKTEMGDEVITIRHDADGDGNLPKEAALTEDKEDETKLSDTEDEDEENEKKETEKSKAELSACLSRFKKSGSNLRLRMREAHIGQTFARLRSQGKITPAEIKKINLRELAAKGDEAVKIALGTYDAREPVIMAGQVGTTKAIDAAELAKEVRLANLENETLNNMRFTSGALGVRMSEGMPADNETQRSTKVVEDVAMVGDTDGMWTEIVRCIQEGREADGKALFSKAAKMSQGDTSVTDQDMAELMSAFADLEGEFGSVVRLAGARLGVQL